MPHVIIIAGETPRRSHFEMAGLRTADFASMMMIGRDDEIEAGPLYMKTLITLFSLPAMPLISREQHR